MKAIKITTGEYAYRGWVVYRVAGEWYIRQEGETYASDVFNTKREAMDAVDCYEAFAR